MRLSSRQCKSARGLLKWNVHDLAFHSRIFYKRIEQFEKGTLALLKVEGDQLQEVFKKEGIVFISDLDVAFVGKKQDIHTTQHLSTNTGAHIVLDNKNEIIKDSTADILLTDLEKEQEEKRKLLAKKANKPTTPPA